MVLVNVREAAIIRELALQRQQVIELQRSHHQRAQAARHAAQGSNAAAWPSELLEEAWMQEAANLSGSTMRMEEGIESLRRSDRRAWRAGEDQTRMYVNALRHEWLQDVVERRALERAEEQAERIAHPSTGDPRALTRTLNRMQSRVVLTNRIERRLRRNRDEPRPWASAASSSHDGEARSAPGTPARPSTAPAHRPIVSPATSSRIPRHGGRTLPSSGGLMVCGAAAGSPGGRRLCPSGVATQARAGNRTVLPRAAWA